MGFNYYCYRSSALSEISACSQKQNECMITALKLGDRSYPFNRSVVVMGIFYSGVLLVALRTFLLWQSVNFLLGIVALASVTVIRRSRFSLRFAYGAIFFAVLSLLLPVKTLLFFSLVCGVFFIIETFYGLLNILPVIIVGMMSPFFQYVTSIFSFPIRLQLTDWAGKLLSLTGAKSIVQGNMIYYNENEFSVDPACMGLNMVVTSLVLGTIVIGIYQKKFSQTLNIWLVAALLGTVAVFNVISNLFRIVCLVQFNILPGTSLHEIIGVICLIVYVTLPSIILVKWVVRRFGKEHVPYAIREKRLSRLSRYIKIHAIVAVAILCSAFIIVQHDSRISDSSTPVPPVKGYAVQRISADIIKLENSESLVYIKAVPGFYSADHNPAICWKGSGYEFHHVQEQIVGRTKLYTARLQKGDELLYTAWWYDNGHQRTIDQLEWRWAVLKGEKKYSVINVTSANKQVLEKQTQQILLSGRLDQLLQ